MRADDTPKQIRISRQPKCPWSFSMIVCGYNEELLLEGFVRKSVGDLSRATHDFQILFIDDGSTDSTPQIADRLAQEIPQLDVIHLGRNFGVGYNFIEGYRQATKDYVFWNTVDGFFDTADLPLLIPHLNECDIVSAHRTDLSANNLYQRMLTLGNLHLIRALFPVKLKAYQTLQLLPRKYLQAVPLEGRSSFIAPELLIKAHASGLRIKEVPIKFHARKAGKARGGKLKFVAHTFRDIFKCWFRWRILREPLAVPLEESARLTQSRSA